MTRSTISPLRRLAATMATLGVLGFGAVAVAPAAFADETPVASVDASTAAPADAGTAAPADATPAPDVNPAPPAPPAPPAVASLTRDASGHIVSPVPDKAIQVKIGPLKIKLAGPAAQLYQSIEANLYDLQGYQITFDEHGVLVIGKKICDPTKSAAFNKGCVSPAGPRF